MRNTQILNHCLEQISNDLTERATKRKKNRLNEYSITLVFLLNQSESRNKLMNADQRHRQLQVQMLHTTLSLAYESALTRRVLSVGFKKKDQHPKVNGEKNLEVKMKENCTSEI